MIRDCRATITRQRLRLALALLANGLANCQTICLVNRPILAYRELRLRCLLCVIYRIILHMINITVITLCNLIRRSNLKQETRRLICDRIRKACTVLLLRNGTNVTNDLARRVRQNALALNGLLRVLRYLFTSRRSRTLLQLINGSLLNQRNNIASKRLIRLSRSTALLRGL